MGRGCLGKVGKVSRARGAVFHRNGMGGGDKQARKHSRARKRGVREPGHPPYFGPTQKRKAKKKGGEKA